MPPKSGTQRNLSARIAACNPCRRSKLACSRERPVCTRCQARGQETHCSYRSVPFKRTRQSSEHLTNLPLTANMATPVPAENSSSAAHRYPNPGFLGQSSHSTIFAQMASNANHDSAPSLLQDSVFFECGTERPLPDECPDTIERVCKMLRQFLHLDIVELHNLIRSWLASGTNLALAGPLVTRFIDATLNFSGKLKAEPEPASFAQQARWLLKNSRRLTDLSDTSDTEDFFDQTMGENLRLEVLGIFLIAACRAAIDIPSFIPLYTSHGEKVSLTKTLTSIGDLCIECCLSLDSLNDLQLVLQYENMILHTQVDGDQSYHSWRRMGDASSSLFALGYHQLPDIASGVPPFIAQLRKAAFARIYTADKMLAVFLGRPPRIAREYCTSTLPCNDLNPWQDGRSLSNSSAETSQEAPMLYEPFNHMADTRCRVRFSFLKEDILKFSRRNPPSGLDLSSTTEVAGIFERIENTWSALPDHLKLAQSLKLSEAGPFANDLLIGIRLDYLHTVFLLHLASSRQLEYPGESLLATAGEMLSLVTEAIMLRDRLVNSGTSLTWKVAQYGLPAAGIISLALLNLPLYGDQANHKRAKFIEDLGILVAKLKVGAIVRAGEANFALFSRATRTMQSLLNSISSGASLGAQQAQSQESNNGNLASELHLFANLEPWEFEVDFWANLADHPTLNT